MTQSKTGTDSKLEGLSHPRCPALGGPVPFRHCRTSGTDRVCQRIPECWWNHGDVLSWFTANQTADPPVQETRLDKILRAAQDPRKPGA